MDIQSALNNNSEGGTLWDYEQKKGAVRVVTPINPLLGVLGKSFRIRTDLPWVIKPSLA